MKKENKIPLADRINDGLKHAVSQCLLFLALLGLFLASPVARAAALFNNTNYIAANTTIVSWPTNVPSPNFIATGFVTNGSTITTNGYYPGQLTGGKLGVDNARSGLLTVRGITMATNTTTMGITLVRSGSDNPIMTINTNNGQIFKNDWETLTTATYSFTVLNTTNAFNWSTNLDQYNIGDYNWVGVYQITNGGMAISNLEVSFNKKILPVKF